MLKKLKVPLLKLLRGASNRQIICIRGSLAPSAVLDDIAVVHFIGKTKPWSNGCLTKQNIITCLYYLKHKKFYELKIFAKYLLYAAIG